MKKYAVVYEWTGSNYSAFIPDLPGCVAAADTFEETETLIKEAVGLYIEALREEGSPIPEPTTKVKSVSVAA